MATGDCRLLTGASAIAFSVVGGLPSSPATASMTARVVSSERECRLAVAGCTACTCLVACLCGAVVTDKVRGFGLSRGLDTAGLGSSLGAGEGSTFAGVLERVLRISVLP